MLVVDSIVPGSYAENLLEPGDVVTQVEGKVLTHFLALEDILDSAVGRSVTLDVERGGQPIHVAVQVHPRNLNLYRINRPSCFQSVEDAKWTCQSFGFCGKS